jgi:hypothetical protein
VWSGSSWSWRKLGRLVAEAALGLIAAALLVALLTLAVVGELPRFAQIFEFSRLYGVGGWAMLPMPTLGLHLAVYVTFGAAIVTATVRAVRGARDAVLTGLLAWSGVFGLIAGGYFAGRSHPEVLIDFFSAWTFTLALLVVVVVRGWLSSSRRPTVAQLLPQLAVLFGFGLAVCSLAQTPLPWSQLARITNTSSDRVLEQPEAVGFVTRSAAPGESVLIFVPLSHRVAERAGVTNVSPYTSIESMPTEPQLQRALDALREAGGTRVFTWMGHTFAEVPVALQAAGFSAARQEGEYVEWVAGSAAPAQR